MQELEKIFNMVSNWVLSLLVLNRIIVSETREFLWSNNLDKSA